MLRTEELLLNVGPQHPSTHGVFRIIVKLDGEVIKEAIPVMGYLHRGTEKLAENLSYTQIIPYTDRMDYVSAMTNNYVLVHAVEKMMQLEIPERAEFLRLIVMELQRVASSYGVVGNVFAGYWGDESVLISPSVTGKLLLIYSMNCAEPINIQLHAGRRREMGRSGRLDR